MGKENDFSNEHLKYQEEKLKERVRNEWILFGMLVFVIISSMFINFFANQNHYDVGLAQGKLDGMNFATNCLNLCAGNVNFDSCYHSCIGNEFDRVKGELK